MNTRIQKRFVRGWLVFALAMGALISTIPAADTGAAATGLDIVVGITPKCPYGMKACWPNARETLRQLEMVERIEDVDYYNCTARLRIKNGSLPEIKKLAEKFRALVGEAYTFRGVEITVEGTVAAQGA